MEAVNRKEGKEVEVVERILAKLVGDEISAKELELVSGAMTCQEAGGYLTGERKFCDGIA